MFRTGYFHVRLFLPLIFMLAGISKAGAGIETFNSRISGAAIQNGAIITAEDDQYAYMSSNPSWSSEFTNHKIKNKVTLAIDPEGLNYMNTPFTATVNVELTYQVWDASIADFVSQVQEEQLQVQYSLEGAYMDKSTFLIESGGNRLQVRVIDYTTDPVSLDFVPNLYLQAEIEVERYFHLDVNQQISELYLFHSSDYVPIYNELYIGWDKVPGAEEYDLEWTHINNYDEDGEIIYNASEITIDPNIFRLNSTRVTIANTSYRIPLTYESGFILYRLRPVGRNPETGFTTILPGSWSKDPAKCPVNSNLQSCMYPNYYRYSGLETGMNWQSSVDFIEEGKNKVNVGYFDATLRNRQKISRLNSENKVLIGETIYDHQGRPAIEVLPVPANKQDIGYVERFNRNLSGSAYDKSDFEGNNQNCQSASPMQPNESGAANYYSSFNPDKAGQQAYIPDAKGFPFTQTQYTLDNTGRIRAQGGVGVDHQIGTGHEARYYYGQPFQEELDRLFGLDVGLEKNYRKNVSVDPNGQVTVTYMDAAGRVIATALAGTAPENLEVLDTDPGRTLNVDLLSKPAPDAPSGNLEMLSTDGKTKVLNRNYIASAVGPRTFNYNINTGKFENECVSDASASRCYNCVVKVTISVKDECGNEIFPAFSGTGSHTETVGNFSPGCTEQEGAFQVNPTDVNMDVGSYQISKVISIDQNALDEYTADFLDSAMNNCLIPYKVFLQEEMVQVDTSGCEYDCDACLERIGVFPFWEFNDYNETYNPDCDPCLTEEQYDKLIASCDPLCKTQAVTCESAFTGMLSDVSPFGQYGGLLASQPEVSEEGEFNFEESTSSEIDPEVHGLSVFNVKNVLPHHYGTPDWKHPYHFRNGSPHHYYDENNKIDYVEVYVLSVSSDGTIETFPPVEEIAWPDNPKRGMVFKAEPQRLDSIKDFIGLWKPSWAKSLVRYHPEYCYYEICLKDQNSHQFDASWLSVDNVAEADAAFGFVNNVPQPLQDEPANATDPYFNSNLALNPRYALWEYNMMDFRMDNYKLDPSTGEYITIWQAAHIAANCPTYNQSETSCPNCLETFNGIDSDEEWIQFRSMYLSLKQDFQNYKTRMETINKGCYNGCIGAENFDPSVFQFYNPFTDLFNFFKYSFSPYFSLSQTCHYGRSGLFKEKTKRFPTTRDMVELETVGNDCYQELEISSVAEDGTPLTLNFPTIDELKSCPDSDGRIMKELQERADRILFETCGQCPLARDIQFLLDAIAREDRDKDGNVIKESQLALGTADVNPFNLSCYPLESPYKEFTADLEEALNLPGTGQIVWRQVTLTDKRLDAVIERNGGVETCNLSLVIPFDSPYDISDIRGICCIHYESQPELLPFQAGQNFRLSGIVPIPNAPAGTSGFEKVEMEGVSCVNLSACPMPPVCSVTAEGEALESLFDALVSESTAASNKLVTNGAEIDILSPTVGQYSPYSYLIRGVLDNVNAGGLNATNWVWTSTETGGQLTAFIKDKNSDASILFDFYLPPSADFGFTDIVALEAIRSDKVNPDPEHYFELTALVNRPDGTKSSVMIKGYSPVYSIGTCRAVGVSSN